MLNARNSLIHAFTNNSSSLIVLCFKINHLSITNAILLYFLYGKQHMYTIINLCVIH